MTPAGWGSNKMAAGEIVVPGNIIDMTRTPNGQKVILALGVAVAVAVMGAVWM